MFDVAAAEEVAQQSMFQGHTTCNPLDSGGRSCQLPATGVGSTVVPTQISTKGAMKIQPSKTTAPVRGGSSSSDHVAVNPETSSDGGTWALTLLHSSPSSEAGSNSAGNDAFGLSSSDMPTGASPAGRNSTGSPTISDTATGTTSHMTGTTTPMSAATGSKTGSSPSRALHRETTASTSFATIIGLVVAGVGVPILVICGIVLAIRRRRHRVIAVDMDESHAAAEAEPAHPSNAEPVRGYVEQGQERPLASQPASVPQGRSRVALFPEVKMENLYVRLS